MPGKDRLKLKQKGQEKKKLQKKSRTDRTNHTVNVQKWKWADKAVYSSLCPKSPSVFGVSSAFTVDDFQVAISQKQ